jgi:uncharacterized protein YbjT (DUF2867 family)
MAQEKVTVFGGTGFLGRHVVQHLLEADYPVRVASRHPERAAALFPDVHLGIESTHADISDDGSIAAAVADVIGVVNAVSLYAESGQLTFHSIHVKGAARVAQLAREVGIERLVHVSGIGSDAKSTSPYIRSRGEGERVVREAFPTATLVRPSVMFGRGDAFVRPLATMLRRLPAFPLFGSGRTRLQPAHVEDVAEAIARAMQNSDCLYGRGFPLDEKETATFSVAQRFDKTVSRRQIGDSRIVQSKGCTTRAGRCLLGASEKSRTRIASSSTVT